MSSKMKEQLCFLKATLLYMDKHNTLTQVYSAANFYKTIQDKAYHFSVLVDPAELLETNVLLGNLLLDNPNKAAKIFQEVIFEALNYKKSLPQATSQSQIVVKFKLQSIPALPGYQLNSSGELLKYADKKRFLQYEGVVTGLSVVHKYTKSARFVCPESGCYGSEGNKYIRLHIAGARETQTIRGDFSCTYCGTPLEEDISCRLLADKLILEVVDKSALKNCTSQKVRFQALTLYARDEQVHNIEIGQELNVVGIPVLDLYQNVIALEVNNVLPKTNCKNLSKECIPAPILKLYKDRRKSPWSFTLSLAYAFAGEVAFSGTFLHVKLGMLLSLVKAASKESGQLDILAVGSDIMLLNRLLVYGAELAERTVIHSNNHHLTAAIGKDRHGSGTPFIEGGSILLAGSGICVVSDIGNIKKQTKYALLQVMESNSVFVDIPAKQNAQQHFLPRRCSIWGCCEPENCKKKSITTGNQLLTAVDQEHVTQDLANAFGQVYFSEVKADTYADYLLQNQGFMVAMSKGAEPLITRQHFKEFIDFVKIQSVKFTEEAELLIRGYYVASRRVRSDSIFLPVTAVKTITNLAGAHAKLSLRDHVSEFDATIAILLYEEQITCRSGYSVVNVQPVVHLPDNNIHLHLGPQLDQEMLHFHQVLKFFIATHASELDKFMEE